MGDTRSDNFGETKDSISTTSYCTNMFKQLIVINPTCYYRTRRDIPNTAQSEFFVIFSPASYVAERHKIESDRKRKKKKKTYVRMFF